MKHFLACVGFLISNSIAIAGVDSSGGVNQVLESCQSRDGNVKLSIMVINNDYLVARLEDYTSFKSVTIISDVVSHSEAGYSGETLNVSIENFKGKDYATIGVNSENVKDEPRIYANLLCSSNLK